MGFKVLALVLFLVVTAVRADAQEAIKLEFKDGQVTLRARNAPVRAILTEWARVGGATIVNGDRVTGAPVTLEVTGMSEQQALDIVLRGVPGYMLAPRPAGSRGASAFDRILILPSTVAPNNPPPSSTPVAFGGRRQPGMPRPAVNPDAPPDAGIELFEPPQEVSLEPVDPNPVVLNPPLRPGGRVGVGRQIGSRQPLQPQVLDPNDPNEEPAEPDAEAEAADPTPSNPFGVPAGSSATPGPGAAPPPQPPVRRNGPTFPPRFQTDREP